jgi:CRP/FNR family cyclic AMP-dependent transcriptional regulator
MGIRRKSREANLASAANGSEPPSSCGDCRKLPESYFCNLPEPALSDLHRLAKPSGYVRGETIFLEGQPAKGVYLLCSGRVKFSTYSEEGKAIILRIAEAGELLGLTASILGTTHETTARAIDGCRAGFVKKSDFLEFIRRHSEAAIKALQQLSHNYLKAHQQICSLGLSASASDKLAHLLLQWFDRAANGGPVVISPTHTHGEIAEMIDTSRETVTRLLNDFRERGLIAFSKHELCIPDRELLRSAMGLKNGNGNGHTNGHG